MLPTPAIIFLASWYPTPQNKNHGIFIKNHALALSKYVPVIVLYAYSSSEVDDFKISKNKQGNLEEWLIAYKKVSTLPLLAAIIKYRRFKEAYVILLNELITNNRSIKAIQVNTIFPVAFVVPFFKNYFKVPVTIIEHWSGYLKEDGNYKGFIQKQFTQKCVALARKIYYVSEKQKKAMISHGLTGNYELIYNVVNTSVFCEQLNAKSAKPLLLHVSSLTEKEKNIIGTLNVIKKLQEDNYKFDFLVVGGSEQAVVYYKEKAKQLRILNTTFVGEKTQQEVAAYMQQASALILFSNYEGMPVVILEALATGLPVFASNVGQLAHLIKDDFGKLVSVGNELELETSLKDFFNGKLKFDSKKMIDFISKNASQEVVGKKLADYYETN